MHLLKNLGLLNSQQSGDPVWTLLLADYNHYDHNLFAAGCNVGRACSYTVANCDGKIGQVKQR